MTIDEQKSPDNLDVSVIIPTYNRQESLRKTLDSLSRQTWPINHYEVIVVDDGSSDGTVTIERENFPFQLRYVRQKNQGAAIARNRGAEISSGELLVFLDDDITVVPQIISSMVSEHQTYQHVIAVATLHPYVREEDSIFKRIQDEQIYHDLHQANDGIISFTECLSGCFSVKRAHYFAIGQMQDVAQDGRTAWGDVDFGYRAHLLGFCFRRSPGAVGYHDDFSTKDFTTSCRRWQQAAKSAVLLFRKYPDMEKHLPMFHDKSNISLKSDPISLVIRKLGRLIISSEPILWSLEKLTYLMETGFPSPFLLRPLYRWITGSYIFRGYQQGLCEYSRRN